MMKRGLSLFVILCILLMIPGIILGARDEPFHLFWNMPFGLKTESFLARLPENPYEFFEARDEGKENVTELLSSRESDIHVMEYPADVAFFFASGLYSEARVTFRHDEAYIETLQNPGGVSEEEAGAHLQKTLAAYFDLLDKMNALYPNGDGQFILFENEAGERIIPMRGSAEDMEEIAGLMVSVRTASLSVYYGNISLSIDKSVSFAGERQSPMYAVYMRYEGDA